MKYLILPILLFLSACYPEPPVINEAVSYVLIDQYKSVNGVVNTDIGEVCGIENNFLVTNGIDIGLISSCEFGSRYTAILFEGGFRLTESYILGNIELFVGNTSIKILYTNSLTMAQLKIPIAPDEFYICTYKKI